MSDCTPTEGLLMVDRWRRRRAAKSAVRRLRTARKRLGIELTERATLMTGALAVLTDALADAFAGERRAIEEACDE